MALQTQYLQVVFAGGVDTKTDAKYVQESKLTALQNGRLTKIGRIEKRFGYDDLTPNGITISVLGTNVALPEINAFANYKDQLMILSSGYAASYSPTANSFNYLGDTPQVLVGSKQIVDDTNNQYSADWDVSDNIAVYAWVDSNSGTTAIRYSVVDLVDNTTIVNRGLISTTTGVHSPKVIILDQYAYILYAVSGSTNLRYRRITTSSWTSLATEVNFPSSNINSTLANQHYDVVKIDSTRFAYAYNRAGGGVTFGIFTGNIATPTISQDAASITENADNCIAIEVDASLNLWVAYHNTSNNALRYFIRSAVLSAVLAPTTVSASDSRPASAITLKMTPQDPTICYIIWEDPSLISRTFNGADVSTANDTIVINRHRLSTGMVIRFTDGGGGLPAGITAATDYVVRVEDANTIKLSTTFYGAFNNADIVNITSAGGSNNVVTPQNLYNNARTPYYQAYTTHVYVGTIAGVTSSRFSFNNMTLVSKAFTRNSSTFFVCEYISTNQPTYYVYEAFTGKLQAKLRPTEAQDAKSTPSLPKFGALSADSYGVPLGVRGKLISLNGTQALWQQGLYLSTLTFDTVNQYFNEEFINNVVLQSGYLQSYDGASLVEYNFHKFPEYFVAQAASTSSSGVGNGTYSYAIVYEWTDAAGIRQVSAPQFSSSVVISGGARPVQLFWESLPASMTSKLSVVVSIYRTTSLGSIYYRISSLTSPTFNNGALFFNTYTDTADDSTISSNNVLYTTGGELENFAPPSPKLLAVNKTRCFVVPSEYPQEVWYTKESIDNTELPGFTPGFVKPFDLSGKEIAAIAAMDDKVICFKEDKVFFFSGDGPNNLGQQDTFTEPELITSDTGCMEPASVTNTPQGLFFKSKKGFYLLSRDLNLEYIGSEVESYNSYEVTSSQLIAENNEVRFTLSSGDSVVFDYFRKQWAVDSNQLVNDSTIYKNKQVLAKSGAASLLKQSESYQDGSLNIPLVIETGWVKLNSIQGFQRVRKGILVGDFKSEHKLKISIAYDYQDYYTDQIVWDADALFDVTLYGTEALYGNDQFFGTNDDETTYQVRFHLPRQKCESVKFKIEDVSVGPSGASMNINHLMLEVGLKQGVYKLNADKTVG